MRPVSCAIVPVAHVVRQTRFRLQVDAIVVGKNSEKLIPGRPEAELSGLVRGYVVTIVVLVGFHTIKDSVAIEGGKDVGGGFYNVLQLALISRNYVAALCRAKLSVHGKSKTFVMTAGREMIK